MGEKPIPNPEHTKSIEEMVDAKIAELKGKGYNVIAFRPGGGFYGCREGEFSIESSTDGYEQIDSEECKKRLTEEIENGWH